MTIISVVQNSFPSALVEAPLLPEPLFPSGPAIVEYGKIKHLKLNKLFFKKKYYLRNFCLKKI